MSIGADQSTLVSEFHQVKLDMPKIRNGPNDSIQIIHETCFGDILDSRDTRKKDINLPYGVRSMSRPKPHPGPACSFLEFSLASWSPKRSWARHNCVRPRYLRKCHIGPDFRRGWDNGDRFPALDHFQSEATIWFLGRLKDCGIGEWRGSRGRLLLAGRAIECKMQGMIRILLCLLCPSWCCDWVSIKEVA